MTRAETDVPRTAKFGRFLYADAGVQENGMTASVLSLLARLDLDPWREAGRLAAMPRAVAAGELARLLARSGRAMPLSPEDAAARLVPLLAADDRDDDAVTGPSDRGGSDGRSLVYFAFVLGFAACYGVALTHAAGTRFQGAPNVGASAVEKAPAMGAASADHAGCPVVGTAVAPPH